jgi:hypothetical protein
MFNLIPDTTQPPDFVNEKNQKWWKSKSLSDYCIEKKLLMQVYLVQHPDNKESFVLIDKSGVVKECIGFEPMACFIDFLHMDRISS